MLKRYYSIQEACDFLSTSLKRPFNTQNLIDLGMREQITFCFYRSAFLAVFNVSRPLTSNELSSYALDVAGHELLKDVRDIGIQPEIVIPANLTHVDAYWALPSWTLKESRVLPEVVSDSRIFEDLYPDSEYPVDVTTYQRWLPCDGDASDEKDIHPTSFTVQPDEYVIPASQLEKLPEKIKADAEKILTKRERDTLLTIIAALAKEAKINVNDAGKAALFIEGLTAELGARVSKRAIEDHLKKIRDALETRMK